MPNSAQRDQDLPAANFNRIARSYRWMEYLTFGSLLQQTRTCFMPRLADRRHALVFGDGDGRFLARLLAQNPLLLADAIDTSTTMLKLLRQRAEPFALWPDFNATPAEVAAPSRLRTHHQHALTYISRSPPDLVATHFFLDCLTQLELNRFIHQLAPSLTPGALWLVSEFRIPPGALALPARWFIRLLYFAFRLLTGLRVTYLPEYHPALSQAGFVCIARRHRLFGLLTAELWQRQASEPPRDAVRRDLGYPHT